MYDDGCIFYEPFLIGRKSFGLTILDGKFSLEQMDELVRYVLNFLDVDFNVTIDTISYDSKDINDESNRYEAIRLIYEKLGLKYNRKNKLITSIKNSKFNRKRKKVKKTYCN